MKKISLLTVLVLAVTLSFAQKKETQKKPEATPAASSGISIGEPDQIAKQNEEMKAWMDYMTPGQMHAFIASMDGNWKEEVTMWMAPEGPPTKSLATCVNKMIMGGRYQESKHNGNMNGMPFEGLGYLGYDNTKKVFVSTWMDNMGTGIMNMEGQIDAQKTTINFVGNCVDPVSGKNMKVREVFKFDGKASQTMEMYMSQGDKEWKSLEIKFTRQ